MNGQRSDVEWGAPVGVGNSRKWDDCPLIDENSIDGLHDDGLRCRGATCALKCQPGFLAVGRRRTKCRWNRRKKEWFWKNTLGSCRSCAVQDPESTDPLMTTECHTNAKNNRRWCKLSCPADHTAANSKKSFVKIACKCPRAANRDCAWYVKRRLSNYEGYTCNAPVTPPPATTQPGNG